MAAGLFGGQVAGRVLAILLSSGPGARFLSAVDGQQLTPLEHRVLVQQWSGALGKAVSATVIALLLLRQGWVGGKTPESMMAKRNVDWVQVVVRAAEVALALGAIFKVVGEFLEERQRTSQESQQMAGRQA